MAFCSNLSRLFRSNKFFQGRGENWQVKECKHVGPIRFNRSVVKQVNFEGYKQTVKAVLILSYEPKSQVQIHKNESFARGNGTEDETFFGVIQNAIFILARVFVIGSVAVGLTITYLITRFTHGHVFPTVLRKSNYWLVVDN